MLPVSVIIPNYNNAPYIERCLLSLADASALPAEILLFDNASQDDSLALAEGLGLPNLRVIRHDENIGAAAARHQAILQSRQEWLCFVDGDDFLSPNALVQACEHQQRYDLDLSVFNMDRTDQQGGNPSPFIVSPKRLLSGAQAFEMTLGRWQIHSMGLMRRSTYDLAADGVDLRGFGSDELLTRRQFLAARRVQGNEATYYYRQVPKPESPVRAMGQAQTELSVLQLAIAHADRIEDASLIAQARNRLLRSLRRAMRSGVQNADQFEQLQTIYRGAMRLRLPARATAPRAPLWRWLLPLQLMRLRLQVLGSGSRQ